MHIKTLLLSKEFQIMIQSCSKNPGPDVVYQIPRGCLEYHRLLITLLLNTPITRDEICLIHSRALSSASNITVTYPKLEQIQIKVHNQEWKTAHESV